MAERSRRIARQRNPVTLRLISGVRSYSDDPTEHQPLQPGDGLALDATRLWPLDVKLSRVGASVIEHVLCRDDVAAGRLVIFGGDAAPKQNGGKIRQELACALGRRLVPDGYPGIRAFDERLQGMRQGRLHDERHRVLLLTLHQE